MRRALVAHGETGATQGGRALEPVPFDARALGKAFALLRDPLPEFMLFDGMMISRQDIPHLRRMARSPRSMWHVARLVLRYGVQRLGARRGIMLYLGYALVARLLKSAIDLDVTMQGACPGPGITLGPAIAFGWIAGRQAAEATS